MISVDAAELDGIFIVMELFSYLIQLIKLQEKHILYVVLLLLV